MDIFRILNSLLIFNVNYNVLDIIIIEHFKEL